MEQQTLVRCLGRCYRLHFLYKRVPSDDGSRNKWIPAEKGEQKLNHAREAIYWYGKAHFAGSQGFDSDQHDMRELQRIVEKVEWMQKIYKSLHREQESTEQTEQLNLQFREG